jgi:hypothetical protein
MDDPVLHAIIGFEVGGALDMYLFSQCVPGATVIATQELIGRDRKRRPKKNRQGYYELVICLPRGKSPEDESAMSLIRPLLNIIAMYSFEAALNPGETAEVPAGDNDELIPVIFDAFEPKGVPFEFEGERFGLLLVIPVHPSELAFARAESSETLIEKLKAADAYPYADFSRPAVV